MRILVVFGSKRGGTAGIAQRVADTLDELGHEVDLRSAREVDDLGGYEALIIGGALYALRWHRSARRLVLRNVEELRSVPVWMFSSGPLDHSASEGEIPPTRSVARLMAKIGARGHATFGGRLAADAKGWIARKMVEDGHGGDFRDMDAVAAWTRSLAQELATSPRRAIRPTTRAEQVIRPVLVGACWLTGLTAVVGGYGLMSSAQGSPMTPPISLLEGTPFTSFFVPGLVLAGVVGLANLAAGVLVYRRHRACDLAAGAAGGVLIGWLVVQMLMLTIFNWLHVAYLGLGSATVIMAVWLGRRRFTASHMPAPGHVRRSRSGTSSARLWQGPSRPTST
jgi:menaquinone-dependent protoporphyrinogen oxidase